MKNLVTFSIIVPIYKSEEYLDLCVQSLINQTYRNIEILLVDDGSPDRSGKLCDIYAKGDSRIRVIHKENGGLSDARNAGLNAATGLYIIFVDSDDYIEKTTCERLLPLAQEGYDIIIGDGTCHGAKIRMNHNNTIECVSGKEYLKQAIKKGVMPMASVLYIYRRHFLQQNQLSFKKGILHEDEEFTPRTFLAARRVMESGVNFYHYIIRKGSITTAKDLRKNGSDLYETCLELEKIYNILQDHELKNVALDSLVIKYLSLMQTGKLYKYGKKYVHKEFVIRNAKRGNTKCKAWLFALSPGIYWHVNDFLKKLINMHRETS